MQTRKHIRILVLVAGSLAIFMIAWAGTKNFAWLGSPSQTRHVEKDRYDPLQASLLTELNLLLSRFDSSNYSYSIEGSFTAIDRTDSAHAMRNIPYEFIKLGTTFHYRLGMTETLSTPEVCLYVDHDARKILMLPPKNTLQPGGLPFKELYRLVSEEGFTLSKNIETGSSLISVKNETHLSCKELSISYDSLSNSIHKIFMRLPDVMDNLDADKETWITLVIKKWNDDPDPKSLVKKNQFVKKDEKGNWVAVPPYTEYDVLGY